MKDHPLRESNRVRVLSGPLQGHIVPLSSKQIVTGRVQVLWKGDYVILPAGTWQPVPDSGEEAE